MKKLILTIFVSLALVLTSLNLNAQPKYALSVQGGYSWLNGVLGGDLQIGHVGFACGWFPTKMPMSGEKINSVGYSVSLYSDTYDTNSLYISLGGNTDGYRYQDSNGYGMSSPMTIVMGGYKAGSEFANLKLGVGYGWCDYGSSWTGEITLGIRLFGN